MNYCLPTQLQHQQQLNATKTSNSATNVLEMCQPKKKETFEVILGNEHPKLDLAFLDNSF